MGMRPVTSICFVGEANTAWANTVERAAYRGSLRESNTRSPVDTAA